MRAAEASWLTQFIGLSGTCRQQSIKHGGMQFRSALLVICLLVASPVSGGSFQIATTASDLAAGSNNSLLVDRPIEIRGNLSIKGQRLVIRPPGALRIARGRLVIRDSDIRVECLLQPDCVAGEYRAVTMFAGSELTIERSRIVVDVPAAKAAVAKGGRYLYDEPASTALIGKAKPTRLPAKSIKIELNDNEFRSLHGYGSALIDFFRFHEGEYDRASLQPVSLSVVGNRITGFHGVLLLWGVGHADVLRNRLVQNSFGQIAIEGRNFRVRDNDISFPGDGTTGDGITLMRHASDGVLENNTISAGTCYGIWLAGERFRNISISRNVITHGITTAIGVGVGVSSTEVENISIDSNVITSNHGFAVSVGARGSLRVSGNLMIGNAPGFPAQIHSESRDTALQVQDNQTSILDTEWAVSPRPFRTNARNADDVYYYRDAN